MFRFAQFLAALALSAVLAACGGGGGGGGATTSTGPTVSVKAVTPALVAPGGTLTLTGEGFSRVKSVSLGPTSVPFTLVSETQLQVVVPADFASDTITLTLAGDGFSAQPGTSVQLDAPGLTSSTVQAIHAGETFTVQGRHLDQVKTFKLGDVALEASGVTDTQATLTAPRAASAGLLSLVDSAGVTRASGYTLSVVLPLLVTSLSRTMAVAGDGVTVSGSGLDAVATVTLDNGAMAAITGRSASALTFTVPGIALCQSSQCKPFATKVTLASVLDRQAATSTLTVGPALVVAKTTALTASAASDATKAVVVTGQNLDWVQSVTIGGLAVPIATQSATQIALNVPAGQQGEVVLSSPYQQAVPAGALSADGTQTLALSQMDFAQVFSRPSSDPALRLTPQRPVLVRAYVSSTRAGVAVPGVTLVATHGATMLGELPMQGPATAPTAASAAALSTTYNALVPAAWVKQGVSFKAAVAVAGVTIASVTAAPAVGHPARLEVVMVPLTVGATSSHAVDPGVARDAFARTFPVANASISMTVRAAHAVTSTTFLKDNTEAAKVLAEVDRLRRQENPNAFYYGVFANAVSGANVGGVGYLGMKGYEKSSPSTAVGYDGGYSTPLDATSFSLPNWAQVMVHEIGHNHSLQHAPCGSAANVDEAFPYAGGTLNPAMALYLSAYANDTTVGIASAPNLSSATQSDLMGYCSGAWLSDYSYNKAQLYAEAREKAIRATSSERVQALAAIKTAQEAAGLLLVSGTVDDGGASLEPVQALMQGSVTDAPAGATHKLRITTTSGQVFDHPLLLDAIADGEPGAAHFSAVIPNPGPIASIEVLRAGKVLARRSDANRMKALSTSGFADGTAATRSATWVEKDGRLQLEWNASAEPYASVVFVSSGGQRKVLALRLEGGTASLPTSDLEAGGHFELGFSSGLNARIVKVAR